MADLRSARVPPLDSDDHVRGPADAPLVIVYSDFECPYCALADERLAAARLRITYRHFPVEARHPRAIPCARSSEAAGAQGRFWEMHDALFADAGRLEDPHLWARARALGLDVERFDGDRRSPWASERVQRDFRSGVRAGVVTTPTLFAAGAMHPGIPSHELIAALSGSG